MTPRRGTAPTGTANPEYIAAMRELRRSNASGKHLDRRFRRKRARRDARRAAINQSRADTNGE